jgi:hypothetical protein
MSGATHAGTAVSAGTTFAALPSVLRIEPASHMWVIAVAELHHMRELVFFPHSRDIKLLCKQPATGCTEGDEAVHLKSQPGEGRE